MRGGCIGQRLSLVGRSGLDQCGCFCDGAVLFFAASRCDVRGVIAEWNEAMALAYPEDGAGSPIPPLVLNSGLAVVVAATGCGGRWSAALISASAALFSACVLGAVRFVAI